MYKRVFTIILILVFSISLFNMVFGVTYTPAKLNKMINELDGVVQELSDARLGTNRVKDLIQEARITLENGDYNNTLQLIEEVKLLGNNALKLNEEIESTKAKIDKAAEQGINVSEVKESFDQAVLELRLENYEQCEVLLSKTNDLLNDLIKDKYRIWLIELVDLKELALSLELSVSGIDNVYDQIKAALNTGDIDKVIALEHKMLLLNDSVYAIGSFNQIIIEMQETNLSTLRFEDLLKEARFGFEFGDYDKVVGLGEEATNISNMAFGLRVSIKDISTRIEKAKEDNVDVSEVEELFEEGVNEFELENYEGSKLLIEQSYDELEEAEAKALLFGAIKKSDVRESFVMFMRRFWWALLLILIFGIVFGKGVYLNVSIRLLEEKTRELEKESKVVDELIKKAQDDYFNKKVISKDEYEIAIDKHQERMLEIREKLPVLREKLNKRKSLTNEKRGF